MYYRSAGPWGPGKGSNLVAAEFDSNTYQLVQMINAKAAQGVGISTFSVVGDELWATLTDHTVLGPYKLPVVSVTFVGQWLPATAYYVNQIFTMNGSTYIVTENHTSASSFDPGANDGSGNDFYGLLLADPANALPLGGAPGQVLEKNLTTDFAVIWAWPTLAGLHDVLPSPAPITGQVVQWQGGAFGYADPATLPSAPQTLAGLADVLPSPGATTDQVVYWNGAHFTYGSLSTLYPVPVPPLAGLSDVAPTPLPTSGQLVYYDGSQFTYEDLTSHILLDFNLSGSPLSYDSIPTHATIPFPVGATILVLQSSSSQATITAAGGVTLNLPSGKTAVTRHWGSLIKLQQTGALDTWNISGELADISTGINALPSNGTFNVDHRLTSTDVFLVIPTGAITMNVVAGSALLGRTMTFVYTTLGTTSFTITFGTNFKSQGPLTTGTVTGKVFVIKFVGDGTNYNELSRTTAM
jgi:hypothetical protein